MMTFDDAAKMARDLWKTNRDPQTVLVMNQRTMGVYTSIPEYSDLGVDFSRIRYGEIQIDPTMPDGEVLIKANLSA